MFSGSSEAMTTQRDNDVAGLPAAPAREWVRRNIPGPDVSGPWRGAVPQRSETASRLAETLAALHAVDPVSVGLGDFGRPGGYCQRQLRTWGRQWEGSRTRDLPDMNRLLDA